MSETRKEIPQSETELNLSTFFAKWGGITGFTKKRMKVVWQDARSHYADLPYHNFGHASETLRRSMELADLCSAHGLTPKRKVLTLAALFHDAGSHEDYYALGYDTGEEYSAAILEQRAKRYSVASRTLNLSKGAILATALGAETTSLEDKILIRADLSNVSGDYARSFAVKTALLRDEERQLLGADFSEVKFAANSLRALGDYFSRDLSFGEFDKPNWLDSARQNILHMAIESSAEVGLPVTSYVRDIGSSALNRVLGAFQPGQD